MEKAPREEDMKAFPKQFGEIRALARAMVLALACT